MANIDNLVTWEVEGSNWTWRAELDAGLEADEVATRAVEDISRLGRGEGPLRGDLRMKGEDMPKVGVIMMVSTSKMKTIDEHLVVLSSAVMANAGMHREAKLLKDEES